MAKKKKTQPKPEPVVEKQEVVEEAAETTEQGYEPEPSISGAPKNFMIRCHRCRWARLSSGVSTDISDLYEIKGACPSCGKWRRFRCPKCGGPSQMKRVKGNT